MIPDRCQFVDPADGKLCGAPGRELILRNDIGGLVRRVLCRAHFDWREWPEVLAERPVVRADRAFLAALGVRW